MRSKLLGKRLRVSGLCLGTMIFIRLDEYGDYSKLRPVEVPEPAGANDREMRSLPRPDPLRSPPPL